MKKRNLVGLGVAVCLSASLMCFAGCSGLDGILGMFGGNNDVKVPDGMQEYTFEAEYTPIADLIGGAQSGSASGYDLIQESSNESVSNGYFIHNIHMTDCTLTFEFNAERAGTTSLYIRMISQWGNTSFNPQNFGIVLNDAEVTYSNILVKGSTDDEPDFKDYLVTQSAAVKQGKNVLKLIVRENTLNNYTHSTGGPAIDCVKLVSDAGLSWTPLEENLDHIGKVEV